MLFRSDILAARRADIIALLSTLFLTRGPIMLTAGDEFGRSQRGNNNAYCQDNEISWIDWEERDRAIESTSFALGAQRRAIKLLNGTEWLTDADVAWLRPDGTPMTVADWESDGDTLCLCFHRDGAAAAFNRSHRPVIFDTPFGSGEVAARSVEIFWSVSAPDCASA